MACLGFSRYLYLFTAREPQADKHEEKKRLSSAVVPCLFIKVCDANLPTRPAQPSPISGWDESGHAHHNIGTNIQRAQREWDVGLTSRAASSTYSRSFFVSERNRSHPCGRITWAICPPSPVFHLQSWSHPTTPGHPGFLPPFPLAVRQSDADLDRHRPGRYQESQGTARPA